MNKKYFNILAILLSLSLTSCQNVKQDNYITIVLDHGTGGGKYEKGSMVTIDANLEENDVFISWILDGQTLSKDNPYTFTASENMNISCSYVEAYDLTYNLDGGIATNPTFYNKRSKTFTLSNPIKEGYTFTGWTYGNVTEPIKNVTIEKGSQGDLEFTAHYEKFDAPTSYNPLRIAVFADVQLTNNNRSITANAYVSLINHFKFCKDNNVDVIMMNGDIVNNAVESYYDLYEQALTSVYGTDESKYPEFVSNMGNHEWWDVNEKNTSNAVKLFKEHARIESSNLVATSKVTYSLDTKETLPTYYKVIDGVPFITISAIQSDGTVSDALKEEINGWIEDILKLDYVKAGGPIFVGYHYPIAEVTYQGQGTYSRSLVVDELFKNIPNAIVFSSDTHFPATNERTINQVNYTNINLGSSSYSRMVSHSATSKDAYDNLENSKAKDVVNGEVAFKYEYTETITLVDFTSTGETKINRYLLNKDSSLNRNCGLEWNIPLTLNKEVFKYTDARFKNKEWANTMYSKDGLEFASNEEVKFDVDGNKMIVYFNDVVDYNYCEHYMINVEVDNNKEKAKDYDFVSNYYKWDLESHENHFVLENIPEGNNYKVTVTAYDFFDNPSINTLVATTKSSNCLFAEAIDEASSYTYSDISCKVNYEVSNNSNSSLEYYYAANSKYNGGILLNTIIYDGHDDLEQYLTDVNFENGILSFDVLNNSEFDITVGLRLVTKDNVSPRINIDYDQTYLKTINEGSGWTTISYNLKDIGINSYDDISLLALKARPDYNKFDLEKGSIMSFYIDNLDIK